MNLNIGDKVIWIEDMVGETGTVYQKITRGKVINVLVGDVSVIQWDNGRIIKYNTDQIDAMQKGNYSGTMILDVEEIRQDKLQLLGI